MAADRDEPGRMDRLGARLSSLFRASDRERAPISRWLAAGALLLLPAGVGRMSTAYLNQPGVIVALAMGAMTFFALRSDGKGIKTIIEALSQMGDRTQDRKEKQASGRERRRLLRLLAKARIKRDQAKIDALKAALADLDELMPRPPPPPPPPASPPPASLPEVLPQLVARRGWGARVRDGFTRRRRPADHSDPSPPRSKH